MAAPGLIPHTQTPLEKLRDLFRKHQEKWLFLLFFALILGVGVPYWQKGKREAAQEAWSLLDLALNYLNRPVDEKNGPFRTEQEKWNQTLQILHRIQNQYDDTPAVDLAWYYAGRSYLFLGDAQKALEQFQEAASRLRKKPLGLQAEWGVATALAQQGKWEEAARQYELTFKEYGKEAQQPEALFHYASALEKSGRTKDAESVWRELKEKHAETYWGKLSVVLKKTQAASAP